MSIYLPPGCTQREIDRQLEDPNDWPYATHCECGEEFVEALDGGWICPACEPQIPESDEDD